MTDRVRFEKCTQCGSIRHCSDLVKNEEGRQQCEDAVWCARVKLKSEASQSKLSGAADGEHTTGDAESS